MSAPARNAFTYTDLRALPMPARPKTAAEILTEAAIRAEAAGDIVMAHQLRHQADAARIAALRQ